jgi:hypothetical protein
VGGGYIKNYRIGLQNFFIGLVVFSHCEKKEEKEEEGLFEKRGGKKI